MTTPPARYRVTWVKSGTLPDHDLSIDEFRTWLVTERRQPPSFAQAMAYSLQRRGILQVNEMFTAHYVVPEPTS